MLIGIVGPHLTVSGAIIAERFVSQRLTNCIYTGPLYSLQEISVLDYSIRRMAQILRALKSARRRTAGTIATVELVLPHDFHT